MASQLTFKSLPNSGIPDTIVFKMYLATLGCNVIYEIIFHVNKIEIATDLTAMLAIRVLEDI